MGQAVSRGVGAFMIKGFGVQTEGECNFEGYSMMLLVCQFLLPLLSIPFTWLLLPNAKADQSLLNGMLVPACLIRAIILSLSLSLCVCVCVCCAADQLRETEAAMGIADSEDSSDTGSPDIEKRQTQPAADDDSSAAPPPL